MFILTDFSSETSLIKLIGGFSIILHKKLFFISKIEKEDIFSSLKSKQAEL